MARRRILENRLSPLFIQNTSAKRDQKLAHAIETVIRDHEEINESPTHITQTAIMAPAIGLKEVSQLADMAKNLYRTQKPVTQSIISNARKMLARNSFTLDDLKNSKAFGGIPTRVGLERIRRELFICEQVGEVSYQLLMQVLSKNNELDILQQVVTAWMDLKTSGGVTDLERSAGIYDGESAPRAADRLKNFLEVHKRQHGFRFWTYNRLKLLLQDINSPAEPIIKNEDQARSRKSIRTINVLHVLLYNNQYIDLEDDFPIKDNKSITRPDDQTILVPTTVSQLRIDFESIFKRHESSEVNEPGVRGSDVDISEYHLSLEIEKARILNTILNKQNVLREAKADARQARAAFDKVSLLPDLKAHPDKLLTHDRDWTEEEAREFGEILLQFGTHAKEGLQEGLAEPLAAENKAENDLADYLEKSPNSMILVGIKAVLKGLVLSRGFHQP